MSLFLYISVPPSVSTGMREAFDKSIKIMVVTDTPIGRVAHGRQSWPVYILMIGMDSTHLVGKGLLGAGKPNKSDRSDLFVSGVRLLISSDDCIFVTLLFHWMHGDMMTEKIALRDTRHVSIRHLAHSMTGFDEDILYILDKDF